ncbi:molybdopterin-synthase adenylyltransferase MoeB [Teredinibacter waterburyi]|uniref:molybdopterin-synthase adenylyltransferase MoeB n=1 Tax=Teredinibacter waterburyi TaxID=1500538 RepID=UPI00165ED241|nr:molybdopterin-synthase adenylyltransferase MoeB [Teredinibacter waterburyi]
MRKIQITPTSLEQIQQHATRCYPDEACGLLIGATNESTTERQYVSTTIPLNNAANKSDRSWQFSFAADALVAASHHARMMGLDIVGFYHSHPDDIAKPSQADLRESNPWPGYSYLIVSVNAGVAETLTAWSRNKDHWNENTIEIVNAESTHHSQQDTMTMTTILIPGPLRLHTDGQSEVEVSGKTVGQALSHLTEQFHDVGKQLFSEAGSLHRFVNIFLNNDDIRMYDGLDSAIANGDVIEILPAISGGSHFQDLRERLQKSIPHLTPQSLQNLIVAGESVVIIDVRSHDERAQGFIPSSIHIDRSVLEMQAERELKDPHVKVVVTCASGLRSLLAANTLQTMGYTNVYNMEQGFEGWKAAGYNFIQPKSLDESQRQRYLRHITLPEVKEEGQIKLLESRVLCIGAGGLGSPILMYLAAAGVGTIGIIDDDIVDASNLQRQIIHTTDTIGKPKTESARAFIEHLNPDVKVVEHQIRLSADNALSIFEQYDVVVDGTDNFATRYLVNDTCVRLDKPFIHGSIFRFDGQMSVFWPSKGPCYRCVYPSPPPPELAPSCSDAGVLGVLPGVIGMLCAVETLKLLLDIGRPLVGKMISYDALNSRFRELNIHKDEKCECCSNNTAEIELADYQAVCSAS